MLKDCPTHTTLPASDLARARAFYEGTLGLEPLVDLPAGVMYGSGDGTRFLVFPSGGSASGTHTQMGFTAQDIEAEVADLRSRGVVFESYDMDGFDPDTGIFSGGPIRSAWFRDTEGNLLGIVQFTG
jgi:catechol 2,3-dioxygenase-like lactoylglutathione lyase family enzyme